MRGGERGGGRGGGDGRPLGELARREWCAAGAGWKTAEMGGAGPKPYQRAAISAARGCAAL